MASYTFFSLKCDNFGPFFHKNRLDSSQERPPLPSPPLSPLFFVKIRHKKNSATNTIQILYTTNEIDMPGNIRLPLNFFTIFV